MIVYWQRNKRQIGGPKHYWKLEFLICLKDMAMPLCQISPPVAYDSIHFFFFFNACFIFAGDCSHIFWGKPVIDWENHDGRAEKKHLFTGWYCNPPSQIFTHLSVSFEKIKYIFLYNSLWKARNSCLFMSHRTQSKKFEETFFLWGRNVLFAWKILIL